MDHQGKWTLDRDEDALLDNRSRFEADPEFVAFRQSWFRRRENYMSRRSLVVGFFLNTVALALNFVMESRHLEVLILGHGAIEIVLILWLIFQEKWRRNAYALSALVQAAVVGIYATVLWLNIEGRAPETFVLASAAAFLVASLILLALPVMDPRRSVLNGLLYWSMGMAAVWHHPVLVKWLAIHGVAMLALVRLRVMFHQRSDQEAILEFQARRLIANAEQIEREKDLRLAREVQESLLPPESLALGATSIQCFQAKHETVCGDWMAVRGFAGMNTVAVVADATGKGVHAALVAQAVQTLWVDLESGKGFDADAWIRKVNLALLRLGVKKPQTMTMGLLVVAGRQVTYWSAGHIPLFVREKNGPDMASTTRLVVGRGGMLGMTDQLTLTPQSFVVPGDGEVELMLASDGLFDRGTRYTSPEVDQMFTSVAEEGARFVKRSGAKDDSSLILVRIAREETEQGVA